MAWVAWLASASDRLKKIVSLLKPKTIRVIIIGYRRNGVWSALRFFEHDK